MDGETDFG